jgi:magnesium transporter
MIRGTLHFTGKAIERSDALEAVGPRREGFVWIDVENQTREDLDLLGERFGFHPLALEDCEHLDQLPKVEEYGDHLFLVIHSFTCDGIPSEVDVHELHIFFGRNFMVTVHQDPIEVLDRLWRRLSGDVALARRGLDFLLYDLCDQLVDTNFPILDALSDAIEEVENEMLPEVDGSSHRLLRSSRVTIHNILGLKHALVSMRKVLSPQREVFNRLANRSGDFVGERTAIYFRNVYDHLVRLYEQIDTDRDLLGNVLDAHFSVMSQRTNDTVMRLTLVSIIFLPLTFLSGFFGMNFTQMPFGNDEVFGMTMAIFVVLPLVLFLWFRRKRWFR